MLHRHSVSHMWTVPSLLVYRPREGHGKLYNRSQSPPHPLFLWLLLHCFTFTVHQTACPSKTLETAPPVCCFLLSLSIFLLCLTTVVAAAEQLVLYKKKSFRVSFNYSRKTKSRVEPSSRPQCKKKSRIKYRTRSVMEAATATAVMMRGSITLFLSPLERSRRAVVVLLLFV